MELNAVYAPLETIEAQAWADLYAAAPSAYIHENGLKQHYVGQILCLSHESLVSAEFARIFGAGTISEFRDAMAWMRTNGVPGWVAQIPAHEGTDDLRRMLDAEGFVPKGNGWAKFRLAHPPEELKITPSVSVREVQANDAFAFGETVQLGFGLPVSTVPWFAQLPGRRNWSTFLAYFEDKAIGCGAMFVTGGVAWLGIGATVPEFRGRGAQSALLRARLAHGRQLGATTFTAEAVQPAPGKEDEQKSYSNCRKAGFVPACIKLNYGQS